jgi:hypothetical protein
MVLEAGGRTMLRDGFIEVYSKRIDELLCNTSVIDCALRCKCHTSLQSRVLFYLQVHLAPS